MSKAVEIRKRSMETLAETNYRIDETPKKRRNSGNEILQSPVQSRREFESNELDVRKQEQNSLTQQLITQQQQMLDAFIQNQQQQQKQMATLLSKLLDKK